MWLTKPVPEKKKTFVYLMFNLHDQAYEVTYISTHIENKRGFQRKEAEKVYFRPMK